MHGDCHCPVCVDRAATIERRRAQLGRMTLLDIQTIASSSRALSRAASTAAMEHMEKGRRDSLLYRLRLWLYARLLRLAERIEP